MHACAVQVLVLLASSSATGPKLCASMHRRGAACTACAQAQGVLATQQAHAQGILATTEAQARGIQAKLEAQAEGLQKFLASADPELVRALCPCCCRRMHMLQAALGTTPACTSCMPSPWRARASAPPRK